MTDALDTQTELAKERNRITADRTLLTWIRTSVSFIGIGFSISQMLPPSALKEQSLLFTILTPSTIGLFFMGLGVFAVVVAALDYQAELDRYRQLTYAYTPRPSLGLFIGGAVVIVSMIVFGAIWSNPFLRFLHQ